MTTQVPKAMTSLCLRDKVIIVTGGNSGIGKAIVEAVGALGAKVVIDYRSHPERTDELIEEIGELGGQAIGVQADVAKLDDLQRLVDVAVKTFGKVDVMVNNAGIETRTSILDTTPEDFDKVMNVNLRGVFVALQRAAKTMVDKGIEGAVVNMSSINAVVSIPAIPAYCASKGGVMQLTKSASLALAPYNIRVNAVGPGSINTEMFAGVNANPDAMKMVMSRTPLQRIGSAREIGDVVAFLASKKASYITGETIYVDGGRIGMNYTC